MHKGAIWPPDSARKAWHAPYCTAWTYASCVLPYILYYIRPLDQATCTGKTSTIVGLAALNTKTASTWQHTITRLPSKLYNLSSLLPLRVNPFPRSSTPSAIPKQSLLVFGSFHVQQHSCSVLLPCSVFQPRCSACQSVLWQQDEEEWLCCWQWVSSPSANMRAVASCSKVTDTLSVQA